MGCQLRRVKTISQVKTFSSASQSTAPRTMLTGATVKANMSFVWKDFSGSPLQNQAAVERVWRVKCSPMPATPMKRF